MEYAAQALTPALIFWAGCFALSRSKRLNKPVPHIKLFLGYYLVLIGAYNFGITPFLPVFGLVMVLSIAAVTYVVVSNWSIKRQSKTQTKRKSPRIKGRDDV